MFLAAPLEVFRRSLQEKLDPDTRGGKRAKNFGAVVYGAQAHLLPDKQLCRSEVFDMVANSDHTTLTVSIAVMAWGGMRVDHRTMAFTEPTWLPIAEDLRCGHISRAEAYARFASLRSAGNLMGMGPAFYTKLIYFLTRGAAVRPQGYIMDQWAGLSINLLTGRNIVLLDSTVAWERDSPNVIVNSIVSNANTSERYEEFCSLMDRLSQHFGLDADAIDRAIVSDGGKRASAWRAWVSSSRGVAFKKAASYPQVAG